jgi:translation elongation factor EF-4
VRVSGLLAHGGGHRPDLLINIVSVVIFAFVMQVFNQRLQDEFNMGVVTTTPSVPYIVKYNDGSEKVVSCVSEWPVAVQNVYWKIFEPYVKVTLICPTTCYGDLIVLIKEKRGQDIETTYLDDGSILVMSQIPWAEVVCDMNDQVSDGIHIVHDPITLMMRTAVGQTSISWICKL